MLDPGTITTWLGVAVAIGGAIGASVKFAFWAYDEWMKRKAHPGFSLPKTTLRLATKMPGNCWWHMGRQGDDPIMQVVGSVFATNISPAPARSPQVQLRFGLFGRKRVAGMVLTADGEPRRMYGMHDIPPGETRDLTFDFWIFPPVVERGRKFVAHSVTVLDQYGNRHTLKRVEFKSQDIDQAKPDEPEERAYQIADDVERQVVAVLQAERARYKVCGRSSGGLGSVHVVYRGNVLPSIGQDSWTPNSPANQLLIPDSTEASLRSENLDALVTVYRGLANDEERQRFSEALLNRIDSTRGYLDVSYFIVVTLMSVGLLEPALVKAREALPVGEQKAFGLSNVLLMMNGLLRYRHVDFTPAMLDTVERFIHGMKEHPFMIPEKIAAIRAARLGNAV